MDVVIKPLSSICIVNVEMLLLSLLNIPVSSTAEFLQFDSGRIWFYLIKIIQDYFPRR